MGGREIIEDKPPNELILEDIQKAIANNQIKRYDGPKEVTFIKVLSVESLFGNKKAPYEANFQFSYSINDESLVYRSSIVYLKTKTGWSSDFQ